MMDPLLNDLLGNFANLSPLDKIASKLGILTDDQAPQILRDLLEGKLNIQDLEDVIEEYLDGIIKLLNENHIQCEKAEIKNTHSGLRLEIDTKSENLVFKSKPTRKVVKFHLDFIEDKELPSRIEFYVDPYQDLLYSNNSGITNHPDGPARITYESLNVLIKSISGRFSGASADLETPIIFSDNTPNISISSMDSPLRRTNFNLSLFESQNSPSCDSIQKGIFTSVIKGILDSESLLAIANKLEIGIPIYDHTENKTFVVIIPYPPDYSSPSSFNFEDYIQGSIELAAKQIKIKIPSDYIPPKINFLDFRYLDLKDQEVFESKVLDKANYLTTQNLRALDKGENQPQELCEYLMVIAELENLGISKDLNLDIHRIFIKSTIELSRKFYIDPGLIITLVVSYLNILPDEEVEFLSDIKDRFHYVADLAKAAKDANPTIAEYALIYNYFRLKSDDSRENSLAVIEELEKMEDKEYEHHPAYHLTLSLAYSNINDILKASDHNREFQRLFTIRLYFFASEQYSWWGDFYEND